MQISVLLPSHLLFAASVDLGDVDGTPTRRRPQDASSVDTGRREYERIGKPSHAVVIGYNIGALSTEFGTHEGPRNTKQSAA